MPVDDLVRVAELVKIPVPVRLPEPLIVVAPLEVRVRPVKVWSPLISSVVVTAVVPRPGHRSTAPGHRTGGQGAGAVETPPRQDEGTGRGALGAKVQRAGGDRSGCRPVW